jgi:exopolysaccharide biosynthesis polyprenyl glycosylphosphotransferase
VTADSHNDPTGTVPGLRTASSSPANEPASPAEAPVDVPRRVFRHPAAPARGGLPVIPEESCRGAYRQWGKRLFDVVSASGALVLLSPVFAAIALAIKLDSPGPVVYRSWRVGEGGRLFRFLKFRSMVQGADAIRESLQHLNEVDGPVFKMARDPRITRVGAFLRRTSLDELPQLWNVLSGDMSLVGPRPPLEEEVLQYEPWQLRRLSVRPGLTCLWQISGRSHIGFDEWMRLDLEYIERRSFALDIKILLRTVPAVVSGTGAY